MEIALSQIAALVQGNIIGDGNELIRGAAPFELAGEGQITVASHVKFLKKIDSCAAAAVIVPMDFKADTHNLLQVDVPMVAFAKIMQYFHPPIKPAEGIDPTAAVGDNFKCGQNVTVGSQVVIGRRVTVGDRVWIQPGVVVGDGVVIGNDVIIYPNVTIQARCIVGNRVIIHAGTVVGSDGFGFAPDGQCYHKIPHIGTVHIDDDVEIGANNTIDRGTFGETYIGRGVKTDNLVHIAHNVSVGDNTVLVAQVGISGSVTIGKNAILAGQAGVAGHLTVGNGATVGPKTGVGKPVPDGQIVSAGIPEMPHRLWLRVVRMIPKLPELGKRLAALEKKLKRLEEETE